MPQLIQKEHYIYAFSKDNKEALRVAAGSQVTLETYDCFKNQIESENARYHAIGLSQTNPATGPVYIKGAELGDVLKAVSIRFY
ncbi:acetamidase/formamidase family protein [Mesobacillus zeae]|uniref:acetamidase/formamidase family protein n=1 Tax=Mesobacillus zeae TaxID=1917180 RepID=UPI0026792E79|nr:acetamidase/formamidase family protein [Mesobacillus zeae]